MSWIALTIALAQAPSPQPPPLSAGPWRLVARPTLHVGVRPAVDVDGEGGRAVGVTVQVTAGWFTL